ncbi:hypothetical protein [Brucella sp. LJL56]
MDDTEKKMLSIHDRIMTRSSVAHEVGGESISQSVSSRMPIFMQRSILRYSIAGIVVLAVAGGIALQYPAISNLLDRMAVSESSAKAALADTPFLAHSKQAGLSTCSRVFPIMGQYLTQGAQYNVKTQWNEAEPDRHSVLSLVGLDYKSDNYSGSAAGVVMATPNGTLCEGTMVRVAPFPQTCADVTKTLPQGSALSKELGQIAVYTLGDNSGEAMLLPTNKSCIVISVATAAQ